VTGDLADRLLSVPPARRWGPVLLQAVKTALACGLSWFVAADALGNSIPVFAPLAALLTVQVTIWESISRGLQRVLGVVAGVVVAYGFARLAGINAWSIGLVVLVSFLLGRVLRLGAQGSVQVPVSALLVLVLGATTGGYAADRVLDTAVGAALGIAVNLVIVPRSHVQEATAGVQGFARELAGVLADASACVRSGTGGPSDAAALLARARLLEAQGQRVAGGARQARTALRWSPSAKRNRAGAELLAPAVAKLRLVERQVRGIARAVADTTGDWRGAPELPAGLGRLLDATAAQLLAWADWLGEAVTAPGPQDRPSAPTAAGHGGQEQGPTVDVGDVEAAYRSVIRASRAPDVSLEVAAASCSMAVDARRIGEELAGPTGPAPLAPARLRDLFAP
jgi:uncharacterized membrane protein YgaE (UPF0421/DUF939 family)